jgi:beta-lactamase regulating signal transducer with metallopeptidase domain
MLSNAAIAAVLALVALAVGRAFRSPAVRHAAWLIVLLKLVTPPLFGVPLTVLPATWAAPPAEPSAVYALISPAVDPAWRAPAGDGPAAPAAWERYRPDGAAGWAVVGWAAGAAGWFAWQGRRVVRFRRRVARAEDAPPEVEAAAARIAEALGIARPPAVKVATGIGSPMLWGWGRGTVVLFPRDLLARLSPEARDTLLAHELAHFLRRDHWVRVLEFVATGLYWWHPAVWLARHGIEAAEEECCDAWVVAGLAASPRRYAEALLAAVDFEAELRRPCLPPGACAASRSARLLQRRLLAIIDAKRPRRLRGAAVAWAVVAAALLTRPVLRAAAPEPVAPPETPVAAEPPRRDSPPHRPAPRKATEPRAWATAAAPGGPTVLARDNEVILRFPDGTTRALGPGRPLAVSFAPGSRRLATVGPGTLVRTWDERGDLVGTAHAKAAGRAVAYTPDGTRLLVLDAAGELAVRDPQTLAPVASWYVEGAANSIACSPDGRSVAVSFGSWLAETGCVEVWSIADRRKLASYPAAVPVGAARFTPSGDTLVIGGWNGRVCWRALPSGVLLAERDLPKALVATAAFSPDAGTLPLEPPPEPEPPAVPEWVPNPVQIPDR